MFLNTRNKSYDLEEVSVNQPYETIYKACLKFNFREFQWSGKAFGNFSSHQELLKDLIFLWADWCARQAKSLLLFYEMGCKPYVL